MIQWQNLFCHIGLFDLPAEYESPKRERLVSVCEEG